jgi:hypothetical protein
MAKLAGSECEMILKLAGDVIGDKEFIGSDYMCRSKIGFRLWLGVLTAQAACWYSLSGR